MLSSATIILVILTILSLLSLAIFLLNKKRTYKKQVTDLIAERAAESEQRGEERDAANRAKNRFLARINHEIRTPMNSIIGFADMLLDTNLQEEQIEYVKFISRSGESLLSLINEILDFSKMEAGQISFQFVDFDVELTAFDVCHLTQTRLEDKPIEIVCKIGDHIPAFVRGDPGRIRQIFVNLMANAAKFTERGYIELTLDITEYRENQLKLHTTVKDTGIGISLKQQKFIFDNFQQGDNSTTRKYSGAGLGLAICKRIARMMDGDIWVESKEGAGSTFHFTAWMDKSEKDIFKKPTLEILANKKVFVLEDNIKNLKILTHVLHRVNMRLAILTKPSMVIPALEQAYKENDPFDIGILDFQMLEVQDFKITRFIRDHCEPKIAKIPLLAASASTSKRTQIYRDPGFDGFLPKPVQKHKLLTMIKRLLSEERIEPGERKTKQVITQYSLKEEAKHSVHILLAEDNQINLKLAKSMLTKAGYHVDIANDGQEATEIYLEDPGKYDLIFMDINMPEMDGRTATRLIRKKGFNTIPIIAITADIMPEDREQALAAGMNDYIAKPIKREIVFDMVTKWVFNNEA